jgi:hypothetical protein
MAMSADDQGSSSSLAAAGIAETNSFFTSEQVSIYHIFSTKLEQFYQLELDSKL